MRRTHPRPLCPRCHSNELVVPIAYGYPTPDGMRDAERGVIVLGGCCIQPHSPKWFCKACEESFGRMETEMAYAR